jgi:hypothetical protein
MKRSLVLFLLCGALVALPGGCSGSQKGAVKGTVTMDGHPLDQAEIEFVSADSKPPRVEAMARSDDQGEFEIIPSRRQRGLNPGKYYIRISKWVDKKTGKVPEIDAEAGQDPQQLKMAGKLKNIVPERYNSADSLTGLLTADIKGDGSDVLKLEVKGK